MTKAEMISRVAKESEISREAAKKAVDAAFRAISGALESGESIYLPDFGKFEARARAARKARNPQTGEALEIPARKTVAFKPCSGLKIAINK